MYCVPWFMLTSQKVKSFSLFLVNKFVKVTKENKLEQLRI